MFLYSPASVFVGTNGRHRIYTCCGRHNKSQAERRIEQEEFYATYDVMTGVRIAATLSGFFGLMVFLIVWKSRSSSNETLKVLKVGSVLRILKIDFVWTNYYWIGILWRI